MTDKPRPLRAFMFSAVIISGGCTLAWFAVGLAIGLSVPSLRESPDMPLWYVLPIVWGLALTAVLMLTDALLWLYAEYKR